MEEETLAMYLEENMHNFYGCFEDMAKVLDVYSQVDGALQKVPFEGGYSRETSQVQSLNSLIKSMAITEYNLHGYEPTKKKNTLLKMQVP